MKDHSSYTRTDLAVSTHAELTLDVSFDKKVISGTVVHHIVVKSDNAEYVSFDCKDIAIHSVDREFSLLDAHEVFGSELRVTIPSENRKQGSTFNVSIEFSTSPSASAVQWLGPEQTAGKKHPFMFTQCQAIHARTLLPCQDSPGAKFTYNAKISVPSTLTALMSAINKGNETVGDRTTYSFEQTVPIPSYLLAIAVGNLESKFFGKDNRCSVWSEPEMIEASFHEFGEDTDRFLSIAEEICGPYVWKHYGVLVLPPSFPYGGMENPCLTFVTPTLLAGDRSLVNVVAHEISHSWFGNLVTCETWEHFWLNEGFTVYLERRIAAHHASENGEKVRDLHAEIGFKHLEVSVKHYGCSHNYTQLIPNLENVDPDDAFSSVPYEKGFSILMALESIVGGPQAMEKYLHNHCDTFQFSTVTSDQFKDNFLAFQKANASDAVNQKLESFDWNAWFYNTGLPTKPTLDTSMVDSAIDSAKLWFTDMSSARHVDISPWQTAQVLVFLENVENIVDSKCGENATAQVLEECRSILSVIDQTYSFRKSKNAEIRFLFYTCMLKAQDSSIFDDVVQFVTEQGRMKFVRPLFRDLFNCPGGSDVAQSTFKQHELFYHSIASKMIKKDLQLN